MNKRKWVRAGPLIAALIVATATTLVAMPLGNTAPDTTFNDVTLIAEEVQYDAILPISGNLNTLSAINIDSAACNTYDTLVDTALNTTQAQAATANQEYDPAWNNSGGAYDVVLPGNANMLSANILVNSSPPITPADNIENTVNYNVAQDNANVVTANLDTTDSTLTFIGSPPAPANFARDFITDIGVCFIGVDTSPPTGLEANVINGFSI